MNAFYRVLCYLIHSAKGTWTVSLMLVPWAVNRRTDNDDDLQIGYRQFLRDTAFDWSSWLKHHGSQCTINIDASFQSETVCNNRFRTETPNIELDEFRTTKFSTTNCCPVRTVWPFPVQSHICRLESDLCTWVKWPNSKIQNIKTLDIDVDIHHCRWIEG